MAKSKKQKAKTEEKGRPQRKPSIKDFGAWSVWLQAIQDASHSEDAASKSEHPRDQPHNKFKMAAYGYYRRLKRKNLLEALRRFIEKRDGTRWAGRGETPAFWVLRLAAKPSESDADRQARKRLAAALELASLNKVRPELLLGFLYEVGPLKAIQKDSAANVKYDWAKYYRKTRKAFGNWKETDTGSLKDGWD